MEAQLKEALFRKSPSTALFPEQFQWLDDNAKIVSVLFVAWLSFAFLLRYVLFPKQSWKIINLIVSLLHSVLALILSSWALTKDSLVFASVNTAYSELTLQISFAYFCYDYVLCLAAGLEDPLTSLHHFISIGSLGIGLWTGRSGSELLHALIFMEASNPCLHARSILRTISPEDNNFTLVIEVLFVVIYFLARVVFGPFLLYKLWVSETPFLMKIAGGLLTALSFYWFYLIARRFVIRFVLKKPYTPVSSSTKKNKKEQ
eukprot:TRINITY_DN13983_c0_g1_i1.p1 TRINITY_DN13983_c0_g1~~TRINITY_DN13983_c0_g1_i1.p1  ORF type:complete len:260 (-),score=60.83 TRINITY_DN13983_c0_g1_i1:74-853(-)